MADLKEIITLINAGFSKDEIKALQEMQTGEFVQEVQEQEKPVEEKEKPVEEKEKAVDENANDKVLDRLDKLEKMLQKNAILRDSVDPTPKDTTKDILASIINPYLENKKD